MKKLLIIVLAIFLVATFTTIAIADGSFWEKPPTEIRELCNKCHNNRGMKGKEQDCAKCHGPGGMRYVFIPETPPDIDYNFETCNICHTTGMQNKHRNLNQPLDCAKCHGEGTRADVKVKHEAAHKQVTSHNDCVKCHSN